ncbi:molybdopterin-guanine dinucleotide biosynthesis protein B [Magnetovibrio blakemorei]|uniref:Molybdopterin-guanine dinucleotide biosynthesis protein B n=1 Tax=Magnetovibrio blakemorei TaxID=28181 RepID=A0A1E5Q7X1_9PROT|nr:molybdopterin-guanine dinucleotide biosynthesis protein B [Magnetovibrio blakemorei]OEJ67368.1 molybdopterin-guanine dinucleotide biosynthesis protein B [Magnetovibrio blakemorei]
MRVFGIVGMSGSGKTELLIHLIPELKQRGLRISTMKHTHHNFDIDKPGKDSYRHRQAGADEVLVSSAGRWALVRELRGEPEPTLTELLEHMKPVDLVLVEGFKREGHDKLEVYRPRHGKTFLAPGNSTIVAVASDEAISDSARPSLDLNDIPGIADFILNHTGLSKPKKTAA